MPLDSWSAAALLARLPPKATLRSQAPSPNHRAVGAGVPSLYIHWPFCARKCPYCDFNVHLAKAAVDEAAWVAAMLADLSQQIAGAHLAPLQTLYFGGGTPSRLSPLSVRALIDGVAARWPFATDVQISLEVHPTSADAAKFAAFADAGVNRASIGVQSFDATRLAFLGRDHGPEEAREAVAQARRHFEKLNLDLMTALPGMTLAQQAEDISTALALGVDHLSVYQLGIEPGTAFGAAVHRGDWAPMAADDAADFYEAAAAHIVAAGFVHYEVSNFARPGAASRHSLLGWMGHGYVGIGAGAEGRVLLNDGTWRARRTRRNPAAYLKTPIETDVLVAAEERELEQLIFGLRLAQGLPLDAPAWRATAHSRLKTLIASGDLERTDTHLRATAQGRLRLDALSDYLINYDR